MWDTKLYLKKQNNVKNNTNIFLLVKISLTLVEGDKIY